MKKFSRFTAILLITLFIALAVCGCDLFEKINEYTFVRADNVTISLPGAKATDVAYTLKPMYYGNNYGDFYADDYMSERTRNRAVTYTMQVLDMIQPQTKIVCYISENFTTMLAYDSNTMYLNENDVKTMDHLINTITVAFDGKLPFGLVYGLAQRVNSAYNWRLSFPKISTNQVTSYINNNPNAADLQAPNFYEETSRETDLAQKAALSFCDYIEERESLIDFCKSLGYGDPRLEQYKKDWVGSLGAEATQGMPCTFSYIDGDANEIAIRSQYADIFIPISHKDYYNYYYGDDFYGYGKNYDDLKFYFNPIMNDIVNASEFISDYIDEREKPQIHFSTSSDVNNTDKSCYSAGAYYTYYIYLLYRYHYELFGRDYNYYSEAIVYYLRGKFNQTELFAEQESERFGLPANDTHYRRLELIKSKYPEYADYNNVGYYEYYKKLMYAAAYLNKYSDPFINSSNGRYYDSSFGIYVVENYGFEALNRLRLGEEYEDIFGFSYSALSAKWWDYVVAMWE